MSEGEHAEAPRTPGHANAPTQGHAEAPRTPGHADSPTPGHAGEPRRSTRLEIGMALRHLEDISTTARRFEAAGFDYLTSGEHMSFHVPMANSLVALSVAAGATSRVKLLSAVTVVPLYAPVVLAKMTAVLDVASGGRFHLGVGVGGEYPPEFEACGVPLGERGARTDEALELMRRLWTEPEVAFRGRFSSFEHAAIAPRPVQRPHPPIFVSGRSRAARRRAARFGDAWMPYLYTPEMVAESNEEVRAAAGREVRSALLAFFCVHPDGTTARAMANERLSAQYHQDFSRLVDRYVLAGTPADVRERAADFVDAGVDVLLLVAASPADYLTANEDLLIAEVLPGLRELSPV